MKHERMKILQLLEDGKISADEAARLLESVKDSGQKQGPLWDEDDKWEIEEKLKAFAKNVENFSKEIGSKLESAYKSMEPKIRSATKTVVEKTAAVVDEISKSLNESIKNFEKSSRDTEENCECECDSDCCRENDEPREN